MATIDECIERMVSGNEITRSEGDDLKELFAEYRELTGSGVDGDIAAKKAVVNALQRDSVRKKRQALLRAQVKARIDADLERYRTPGNKRDIGEAAIAIIEHYGVYGSDFDGGEYASVVGRKNAIVGMTHARIVSFLEAFERTKVTGQTPDQMGLDNVVRELFGDSTGDVRAKEFANILSEAFEDLRARFNRAGGEIGKLEKWGLPQNHNPVAMLAAGKDTWKKFIIDNDLLDTARMKHPTTGVAMSEKQINVILDDIWKDVVTHGWHSREPELGFRGQKALANRRAEHRYLHFKNADAWLQYQREFGEGDPFAAMMGHINLMSRDIAMLEVLGPNPGQMIDYLRQKITEDGAGNQRTEAKAARKIRTLNSMYEIESGIAQSPESTRFGSIVSSIRNVLSSSLLGSALLSALPTDPIFGVFARYMNGMPAFTQLGTMIRNAGKDGRFNSVRAGRAFDAANNVLRKQARYVGTLSGPTWSRWLADRTLTWSGLTPFTSAGRAAFHIDFTGFAADQVRTANWDQLRPRMRRAWQRYGFTADDWAKLKQADIHDPEGAAILRPQEVAQVDQRLAERYLEMINAETEYAVPSGTLRGRAALIGSEAPGTMFGEIRRSFAMFKSFPATFLMLHGMRWWGEHSRSAAAGAAYLVPLLLATTMGGAASLWLKDIAAGRDPRPIADPEGSIAQFWGHAFLQGGGVGIFGDFLFADVNRYGGGLAQTLAGPVTDRFNTFRNLTIGNLLQLAAGEDTNFMQELAQFVTDNVPAKTLWFWRAGYDRVIADGLQRMVDPEAAQAFRRSDNWWLQNYGASRWWGAGQTTPERAPDLSRIAQ